MRPRDLELVDKHKKAADVHDLAADRHDTAAERWASEGNDELADLERRNAQIERDAAELERERAALHSRQHSGPARISVSALISGPEANAALVTESFQAFNRGDTESLLAVVAPDLVMHLAELPEPLRGRETWQQGLELMKRAFPDLEAHIDDLVAAEDRVAVRVSFTGTHAGEFQGIPATGRSVRYVSHEFYRVADGMIAEEWICSDMTSLFRQLA